MGISLLSSRALSGQAYSPRHAMPRHQITMAWPPAEVPFVGWVIFPQPRRFSRSGYEAWCALRSPVLALRFGQPRIAGRPDTDVILQHGESHFGLAPPPLGLGEAAAVLPLRGGGDEAPVGVYGLQSPLLGCDVVG